MSDEMKITHYDPAEQVVRESMESGAEEFERAMKRELSSRENERREREERDKVAKALRTQANTPAKIDT